MLFSSWFFFCTRSQLSPNLINFKNFTGEWWVSWGRQCSILPPTLLLGMIHTPKMDVLCTFFPVQGRYSSPSPPTQNHSGRVGCNLVSICYWQFDILASYDDIVWGLQMEPAGPMKAIALIYYLVSINAHTTILGSQMVYLYILTWVGGGVCPSTKNWNQSYFLHLLWFYSFPSCISI